MGFSKIFYILGIVGITNMMLAGCSSDDAAPVTAPASYAGVTTEATVTSSNSKELSEASLDGAGAGTSVGATDINSSTDSTQDNNAHLLSMVRMLRTRMMELDVTDKGDSTLIAAVNSYNDTVTSSCGGSYSYTYTLDSVTYAYSGTYTYNEYTDCDSKGITSGSITYTGTFDTTLLIFPSLKYEFTALTYKHAGESTTMTGSFDLVMTTKYNLSFTMNMDFRDNVTNETFRVENYLVTIVNDIFETYGDYQFSGKFYHSIHGYVTISTLTPVRAYYEVDDYPTSGAVKLVGASGSVVVATFTSNNTYTLEIDSDGDTVFETTKYCTQDTDTCI